MGSPARLHVVAILLVGCGATGASGTGSTPAAAGRTARSGGEPPAAARAGAGAMSAAADTSPAPGDAAADTSPAPGGGPDRASTPACVAALEDQRQLHVGVEVEVHPARRAAFLDICGTMPPAYQRCASPLHQIEHEAECAAVHDDEDRAAKAAWHRTFDLLSDPRPDLPPAPVER